MLARDCVTIMNDVEEFGVEWQARKDEPNLREDCLFVQAAEAACAHNSANDFDF